LTPPPHFSTLFPSTPPSRFSISVAPPTENGAINLASPISSSWFVARRRRARPRQHAAVGANGPLDPRQRERIELLELDAHAPARSEEHTSELQSLTNLVCRL